MDLFSLECVCCGSLQPRASFGDRDPHLCFCCTPLDEAIVRKLKMVAGQLHPTGDCYFCGQPQVGDHAVFCCRQSCAVLYAASHDLTLFHFRPCAWTSPETLSLDTQWDAHMVAQVQQGPQPLPAKVRAILGSIVLDDPLEAFLFSASKGA